MRSRTWVACSGGVSARNRNDTSAVSTGPPKYNLSSSCARRSRSGKRRETAILVGLLMMTPAGAGPMLFITSTTESLKLESASSARATRRIVVKGFVSSADVGHEIPEQKEECAESSGHVTQRSSTQRLRRTR